MSRFVAPVTAAIVAVAVVASIVLLTAGSVANAQQPTVMTAPPAGGLTSGASGTTDVEALIAAQTFSVASVWKLDIAAQVWQSHVPGAPVFANNLVLTSVDDIVFLKRSEASPGVEQLSGAEPTWTEARYFPEFPPSDKVFVISVTTSLGEQYFPGSYDPDWRINNSVDDMMALTLVGMQGVINRHGPKVFLDWQEPNSYARYWLDRLEREIETEELNLGSQAAVDFLLQRYGGAFSGAVIYDPAVPDTINLATMIAGVEDRVMLAPEQLGIWGFDSVTDLREMVAENGWGADSESQTAIYQWAYDNLWPDLDHRMIGLISPGPTTSGEFDSDPSATLFWPLELNSRDYYVALRIPALYLHPVDDPQATLLRKFLEEADSPIPVLGIFGFFEEGSTQLANEYGNFEAGLSWPGNVLAAGNLSVLSGVRPDIVAYEAEIRPDRILATVGAAPVAAVFSTDGDALFYSLDRGFLPAFPWEQVQSQRFGWTTNPTLIDLAPLVWNHYVEERTEVGLVSGLSGAGYIFPHVMTEAQLQTYLEHAAPYLAESGLRVVQATLNDGDWDARMATQFSETLADGGLLGMIVGYGGQGGASQFEFYADAVPSVWPSYVLTGSNATEIAENLLLRQAGDELLDIGDQHISPGVTIEADSDAVSLQAAMIPPSFAETCCLAIASGGVLLQPGSYQLVYRMKVSALTTAESVARIYIGTGVAGWTELAGLNVSTGDFDAPDQYQDFVITFEVEEAITGAEIRVDYHGADTALYLDTVRILNAGAVMPVFSLIRMSWEEGVLDAPGRFVETFEAGGGVALTVDEFMAALNPQFMLEFATQLLGSGHAGVLEAAQLLDDGKFLASLVAIRQALSEQ